MASNTIIPDPREDGYYTSLDPEYEQFMITKIQGAAPPKIDSTNAGELLFLIWNEAAKFTHLPNRPPQFSTRELCDEYVGRDPDRVALLAAVHEKKAYAWLCTDLALKTPPMPPAGSPNLNTTPLQNGCPIYSDLPTVKAAIDDFVRNLRPKIQDFLTKQRLPDWVPPESVDDKTREFYKGLAIPLVNGKPSLLLHNLGNNPNPIADNLFQYQQGLKGLYGSVDKPPQNHRILCNTSGSGKTRLLFEGLCRHWGFYFVVAQGTDGIGAPDLEAMIQFMSMSSGWIYDIFQDHDPEKVSNANTNNERIAFTRISKVVLARWIVFQTFIQVAKELNGGVLHDNIRRDWLFFQILPLVRVNSMDPFLALIDTCLVGVNFELLRSLRMPLAPQEVLGSAFDPTVDFFFYVLDEAQVAGKQYMGAFADADGKVPRPVLRPIIRHLASPSDPLVKIIVSGTGFSLKLFTTVLTSGVGKDSSAWDVVHTTGDFVNKNTQLAYISRYFPPSFLLSQSGDVLKARMYEWLRGRHRFTARYLEELMRGLWKEDRPASPHKLLNAYVYRLADFTPLDGDSAILEQEADVRPIKVETFQWDKIEREQGLLEVLAHSIYTYMTRGEYPMWFVEQESLVEFGLARFTGDGVERESLVEYGLARFTGNGVAVEEPLALVSIVHYFENRNLTLSDNIRRRLQDNKGTAFEELVLLALTKLLRHGQRLKDIFQFHGRTPSWARCTAQIVTRTSSGDFEDFDLVNSQPLLPSRGIAFSAEGPDDVRRWLENGQAGWCLPGILMGPDLMAWVRLSNGKALLLVIQAKCHFTGNKDTISAEATAKAIKSLIPDKYFASLVKDNMSETTERQTQQKIDAMLAAINQPDEVFTHGRYNILRVVAAFPLGANFNTRAEVVNSVLQEDNHALAQLTRSALTSALASYPSGLSIITMLTKTLKRARGDVDDEADRDQRSSKSRKKVPGSTDLSAFH